jgi:hypothetical protein
MFTAALIWMMLASPGDGPATSNDIRAEYDTLNKQARRDADARVRLALWCERHGMLAERSEQLALAVFADPKNTLARALLGQVRYGDRWVKADHMVDQSADHAAILAEYKEKRAKTEFDAGSQAMLAEWCERHGLTAEARAHWKTVVRIDPSRDAVWRKLGYKKHQGRWLSDEQLSTEQAELKAQARADRDWQPRLLKIVEQLKKERERATAEKSLAAISDPRAVPSIWRIFVTKGAEGQEIAVRLFGQIDAVAASQALGAMSVHGANAEVRRTAAENLRRRDRREYLHLLIGEVRKPLKYELRPNAETNAMELYVEGVAYDLHRTYRYPSVQGDPRPFFDPYFATGIRVQTQINNALQQRALGGLVPVDPALQQAIQQAEADPQNAQALLSAAQGRSIGGYGGAGAVGSMVGLPGFGTAMAAGPAAQSSDEMTLQAREQRAAQNIANFQAAVAETEERIKRDCAQIDALNDTYTEQNKRVLPVLTELTSQDLGADPQAWTRWWTNELGYSYRSQPKPVFAEVVAAPEPLVSANATSSCFAAGTPVQTMSGPRAIEQIQVGDQVLSQDVTSGALRFEPVVAVWHNRPDQTFRIKLGDEEILSTEIHRFWKAGQGWTMVRDLKPGDQLRTRDGLREVKSIEPDRVVPVFNLEVENGRSFFVGAAGALVHDYTLIEKVDRPFDSVK